MFGSRLREISIALAVAAFAAACGSSGGGSGGLTPGPSPTSPTATPTASTGPTSGPTSSPVPSPTATAGGTPGCLTSRLAGSTADADDAAGHSYEHIVLTNHGPKCVLGGFPGVSFVDSAGKQIGAPADREGAAGPALTLASGQSVKATLTITHIGPLPGCETSAQSRPAYALKVYPPANLNALVIRTTAAACTNPAVHQLRVTAFTR